MNDYVNAVVPRAEQKPEGVPFAEKVYALGKSLEKAVYCMEKYSMALGGRGLPNIDTRELGKGLAGVIEESQRRVDELTCLIESCRHLIG